MREELRAACAAIEATGARQVEVRGAMRLTPAFLAGRFLPDTRGFQLAREQQGGQRWSTASSPVPVPVVVEREELDFGEDLAVGLSVARLLDGDVRDYLREAGVPVGRFVHLRLPEPGSRALPDAAHALGWVMAVRQLVAQEARSPRPGKVHLFLATPLGAALFLGYFWNRLPATQLYEDLNPGYCPSFLIPA
jgi:SMODS-associated and fused to various effectors sensor domain